MGELDRGADDGEVVAADREVLDERAVDGGGVQVRDLGWQRERLPTGRPQRGSHALDCPGQRPANARPSRDDGFESTEFRRERTYVRVGWATMEPAVHRLSIVAPQPAATWQRLEAVLAESGSPPIAMAREPGRVTFTCDTGDFMLRARVADALMSVCDHGEWRRCFAPED
jgi:hypothetical protein